MSGAISEAGVWKPVLDEELHRLLLLVGRDGREDLLAVGKPEVGLDEAADEVGDVAELAVPLGEELVVHVPQQVVVLARLRGGLDQVAGDAVDVLEPQLGGADRVGAEVLGLLRRVLRGLGSPNRSLGSLSWRAAILSSSFFSCS